MGPENVLLQTVGYTVVLQQRACLCMGIAVQFYSPELMQHLWPAAKKLEQAERKLSAASAAEADLKVSAFHSRAKAGRCLSHAVSRHSMLCTLNMED